MRKGFVQADKLPKAHAVLPEVMHLEPAGSGFGLFRLGGDIGAESGVRLGRRFKVATPFGRRRKAAANSGSAELLVDSFV